MNSIISWLEWKSKFYSFSEKKPKEAPTVILLQLYTDQDDRVIT